MSLNREDSIQPYLVLALGEVLYTVPKKDVVHIVDLPGPDQPQPGPTLFHNGTNFTKLDPRLLFNVATPPPLRRQAVLQTLKHRSLALVVDRVEQQLFIDSRRFQPIPWHFGGREQLWFGGALALDDHRPLVLLRPQGLLASNPTPTPAPGASSQIPSLRAIP